MNTIFVTQQDLDNMNDYDYKHYFKYFIFNEFKIVIRHPGCKVIYKVRVNDSVVKVKFRAIQGDWYSDCEFSFKEDENGYEFIDTPNGEFVDKCIESIRKSTDIPSDKTVKELEHEQLTELIDYFGTEMAFVYSLKQYVMNKSYERKVILKELKCENRENSGSDGDIKGNSEVKTRTKGVKIPQTQFLLDDIIEYVSKSGRKHGYICECWDVRGHFRHYKTGKVAWIPPYEKGKQRNSGAKTDTKVYKL